MNTNDAVAVLHEVADLLVEKNWRGDLTEGLRDIADSLAATDSAATVAKEGEDDERGKLIAALSKWATEEKNAGRMGSMLILAKAASYLRATPKPEASAATQQVGEVLNQKGRYLTIVFKVPAVEGNDSPVALLKRDDWTASSWSHAMHDRDDARAELSELKARLAAPISEDTHGFTCICDACSAPAAPVSDGDAMPPLPPHPTPGCRWLNVERDAIRAYVLADRAARTVTGSGESIVDDEEFHQLLNATLRSCFPSSTDHKPAEKRAALIAYIDARTARNAGVAAPDTSARQSEDAIADMVVRDAALEEAAKLADDFDNVESRFGGQRYDDASATKWAIAEGIRALKTKGPAA